MAQFTQSFNSRFKLRREPLLQLKETELKRLQQEEQDISRSAQSALRSTEESFKEMVLLLEKRRSEVEQQIHSEQQTQLRRVRERQEQLLWDVTELKKDTSELGSRPLAEDQSPQLRAPLSTDEQKAHTYFEDVNNSVSELSHKLKVILEKDVRLVSLSPAEPTTRDDFLQYATNITLDPNTAHKYMELSDGNRRVTFMMEDQNYPDHPERFEDICQVLSKESLPGRCYWEVHWSGEWTVIAVSYRDIQRKGTDQSSFGFNPENKSGRNDKSWALECGAMLRNCSFHFNGEVSGFSGFSGSKVGVYLDHSAGTLSFYKVQNQTMSLLHKVQTRFTRPLYAGIHQQICGSSAFVKLK